MSSMMPRVFACVAAIVGAALLPPFALAAADGDAAAARAFAACAAAGLAAAFAARPRRNSAAPGARHGGDAPTAPNPADAIAAVGAAWIAVCLFGAAPLRLCGACRGVTDAVFESVSGFTTTGATVIADVEALPRAVNLWRCETHWLGGMGVVALAVAFLPLLGVGGFRLMNAESTGPEKGKLTARVADTARTLWLLYVSLTVAQVLLLRLCGMGWFDATCHAFSTLGTGGFSTRNASLAAFGNPAAEWVCTAFMLAAAVNFGVYHKFAARRGAEALRSTELRAFVALVAVAIIGATAALARGGAGLVEAARLAAFQVASIISTTGFASADYAVWVPGAQTVLLALFFVGGCSGSTAGGVKVVRWAVLAKQAAVAARRFVHPRAVYVVRIDGRPVRDGLVAAVAGFVAAYAALVGATALAGAFAGLQAPEAFTAALSMAGNVGPAFGALGPSGNYGALPAALKWWYCAAMLAGRLEVFTMLALIGRMASAARPKRGFRA